MVTNLVIGSNSFSGASFVDYLLKQGERVVGISRSVQPVDALLPYKWRDHSQFKFHQLDLNLNLRDIENVLDLEQPSTIYNFAAQSMVGQSWLYPEDWFQTNTVSFSKLLNILREKSYIERYLHISTPEVYGSNSEFIEENDNFNPSTPYAISRAAGDLLINAYFKEFDFPVITTRAANVYGPGQQLYRIIPKTIMSILSGKRLPLHGGGISERSFIHMDDVSAATYGLSKQGVVGESYHISTKNIVSIKDLVSLICEMLDVDFSESVDVMPDRVGKDQAYLLDPNKLQQTLEWYPKISLESGLESTVNWVKSNYDSLKEQSMNYEHKA